MSEFTDEEYSTNRTVRNATIEEATKKAHEQEKPQDDATITITDRRFLGSNIKIVSDKKDGDTRPQTNQGSESEAGKMGTKNE